MRRSILLLAAAVLVLPAGVLLSAETAGGAITEGARKIVGVMHKNAARFAGTGGWGFEGFKGDGRERAVTDMAGQCFSCHAAQKKTDYVFTAWRP